MTDETDDERFRRVAAIFEPAAFLPTLGVRLDAVGPGWCETSLPLTPALRQNTASPTPVSSRRWPITRPAARRGRPSLQGVTS